MTKKRDVREAGWIFYFLSCAVALCFALSLVGVIIGIYLQVAGKAPASIP